MRQGSGWSIYLPAVSRADRDLVAAAWCAGYFFVVVVPCVVDRSEELEAIDLWWEDTDANVREECLVVAAAQIVVFLAAPFVVDADLHGFARTSRLRRGSRGGWRS